MQLPTAQARNQDPDRPRPQTLTQTNAGTGSARPRLMPQLPWQKARCANPIRRPIDRRPSHGTAHHGERGSAGLEAAVLAPAIMVCIMLVVYSARVGQAERHIFNTVSEAARAASLKEEAQGAQNAARQIVQTNLENHDLSCKNGWEESVEVDTSEFYPGGYVTVFITCEIDGSDLSNIVPVPSRTFSTASTEPIDHYRSGEIPRRTSLFHAPRLHTAPPLPQGNGLFSRTPATPTLMSTLTPTATSGLRRS